MITGTITAMVTPFINGAIDYDGFQKTVAHQLAAEIPGLLVLGSTGELATITDEERTQLIKLVVAQAKSRCHIMVGTGSNSTQKSIAYTREAQELGADSALVVTPYYNCPTQEGLFLHFAAIAQATQFPMGLYNNPKRTGRAISVETMLRLSALSAVTFIKEASGDISVLQELLEKIDPRVKIFTGDDGFAFCAKALGGAGVISVASNLIPQTMQRWMEMGLEEARALNFVLQPLFRALFIESNPIPIKRAMEFRSLIRGECRLPLTVMKEPERLLSILPTYKEYK